MWVTLRFYCMANLHNATRPYFHHPQCLFFLQILHYGIHWLIERREHKHTQGHTHAPPFWQWFWFICGALCMSCFFFFFKPQFKSSYLYSNASKNISQAILTGYMHATLEKIRMNTLGIGNVYRLCECHMQTKSSLLNVCNVCILHSNKNIFTFKYVKVCFLMFKNIISMG